MAHELTLRADGRAEMAFVGETPWHGLGQSVTKGASVGVWAKEAGMDWEAKQAEVFYRDDVTNEPHAGTGSKVIYRSDTYEPLSIMGDGYNMVQPLEVLEFFRDLTEGGGWHIHTAGTLRGGRKLWAMASNGDGGKIGKSDEIKNNLLLATSLDGSMKTIAALTAVRVVCANTLAVALQSDGEQLKISHRSMFDPNIIKTALGVARESFEVFMEQAREMADTPIKLDEAREALNAIFGVPAAPAVNLSWLGKLDQLKQDAELKESRVVSRVLDLFEGEGMGAGMKGSKGTRWGLFNAVTQHVDHEMGRSDDTRLDSAWFGRGNGFKQEAFNLLVAA